MSTREVAALLGLSDKTLANWRCSEEGRGPPFHKFGGRVRYKRSEVLAWIDENRHCTTLEYRSDVRVVSEAQATRRAVALAAIDRERAELWQRIADLNAQAETLE
jgi:excisionase family DNA binding protein